MALRRYLPGMTINGFIFIRDVSDCGYLRRGIFLCHCGKEFESRIAHISSKGTKSCGCTLSDGIRKARTIHGCATRKHITPEFKIWCSMKNRCYFMSSRAYKDYGGRGIIVCERWLNSFDNFLKDMGTRPSERHTIERKDYNGNYEPQNCKWLKKELQARNKRNIKMYSYKGIDKSLPEWCEIQKVDYELTRQRINRDKWDFLKALNLSPETSNTTLINHAFGYII